MLAPEAFMSKRLITGVGIALVVLFIPGVANASSFNCLGVAAGGAGDTTVVDTTDASASSAACIIVRGGVLALNGTLHAGYDLGSQTVSSVYTYDSTSMRLLTDTDAAGLTTFAYDGLGRLATVDAPSSTHVQFTYDSN